MKKLLGLILIVIFFTIANAIPFAHAKVKHSAGRSEEQRHGRTVKSSNDSNDKREKRKSSRDANEPSKQAKRQDTAETNADKPKDPPQQLKMLESQMAAEKERFLVRKAQLERTMDQANQQGDKKRADLAKDLLAKEQQQYDQKKQLQEEKRQKLLELIQQQESPKDANKPAK